MVNKHNTRSYKWGENCLSWVYFGNPNLSIKRESLPIGERERKHYHERSDQFFYVISGKAHFFLGDTYRIVEQDEGIHIPPLVEHYVENIGNQSLEILVISVPDNQQDRINI